LTGEAKRKGRGGDKPTEAMKMRSGRVDERITLYSTVKDCEIGQYAFFLFVWCAMSHEVASTFSPEAQPAMILE
jgi:hypothetical protein